MVPSPYSTLSTVLFCFFCKTCSSLSADPMGVVNNVLTSRFFPLLWGCGVCNLALLMVMSSDTIVLRAGEPYVFVRCW